MKIHLKGNPHQETIEYYKTFAELTDNEDEADIIVVNTFEPANYPDKIVAINATNADSVTAKEVIKLYGEELKEVVAVPELCLWAMLEMVRKRDGRELNGKIIGIIGDLGRIGYLFASMCDSIGMLVKGCDIKGNRMNLLPMVLSESDIVSLHISSTEENRNFFDRTKFEQMKSGSYFLNSTRGYMVDNEALKWALESGKLAGAWSDFPTGFEHKNLLVTEHQGGNTYESKLKTELIIANKIKQSI